MLGNKLHLQMKLCDWCDFDESVRRVLGGIEGEQKVATPFAMVGFVDAPYPQLRCARIYSRAIAAFCSPSRPRAAYPGHDRIRVAYFSAYSPPTSTSTRRCTSWQRRSSSTIERGSNFMHIRSALTRRTMAKTGGRGTRSIS
jgi:hypothetical protein